MGGILVFALGALVLFHITGKDLNNLPNVINDVSDSFSSGEKTYANPPEMKLEEGKDYSAKIVTSKGDITVDLFEKAAPETVNNFVFLANDNFYNDNLFHRVIKGFVIQGGDRNNKDGTGGPGYTFGDEINWDAIGLSATQKSDLKAKGYASTPGLSSVIMKSKVLAMANSGPNTNGSQFFVMLDDVPLPPSYTIFGEVVSGIDVVDQIQIGDVMESVEIKDL
ncbi:peptidylprolyl isomerase [Candidatus Dojkabacteria bacterium]|uniref:Peptidyl-prolyl cis-trans isomerase n=1 Tax=Candidatus Dojkabacteria bacterium TaxID=2099670 RepID=A0A955RM84_9BACT|nr:peptidylprolyl isomerase [Candidatus Dojkabacteria bacterium]